MLRNASDDAVMHAIERCCGREKPSVPLAQAIRVSVASCASSRLLKPPAERARADETHALRIARALHLLATGRLHDQSDALEALIAEAAYLPLHYACRVAERALESASAISSVSPCVFIWMEFHYLSNFGHHHSHISYFLDTTGSLECGCLHYRRQNRFRYCLFA